MQTMHISIFTIKYKQNKQKKGHIVAYREGYLLVCPAGGPVLSAQNKEQQLENYDAGDTLCGKGKPRICKIFDQWK